MMGKTVLTIGHSNHTIEKFIELLLAHNVTAVADVRSAPYSRFNPDFNREFLKQALKGRGILYVFLGRELGARPEDPSCYVQGRVQYRKLAESQLFKEGLVQLHGGAEIFRLALLCAEREPLACHRTILVARELVALGVLVAHIHADGSLEPHNEAMIRLVGMLGMSDHDLYSTTEEMIADACAVQEKRIAYLDEEMREEASA
jgi:uncharacterized protein (DUF488 family)